jgi:hypothetical protein
MNDMKMGAPARGAASFGRSVVSSNNKFIQVEGVTRGRCYKTFYRSNLPPFHGNTIILCYKAILPWKLLWNGSILLQYINPRKRRVRITMVIYRCIVL